MDIICNVESVSCYNPYGSNDFPYPGISDEPVGLDLYYLAGLDLVSVLAFYTDLKTELF